jgi:hypothetical protein
MSPKLKTPVVILGGIVFTIALVSIITAVLVSRSDAPGGAERVAAKIVNFKIPKNFQIARSMDLLFMSQVILVSTDPRDKMMIILEGMYLPTNRDVMDQGVLSSMKSQCAKITPMENDPVVVNGETFTFRRFSCSDGADGRKPYEYEFGSFVGKAPLVTMVVMGPKSGWNPAPIHDLLKSFH